MFNCDRKSDSSPSTSITKSIMWPNPVVTIFSPTTLRVKYFSPSVILSRVLVPPAAMMELLRTFPILFSTSIKDLAFSIIGDSSPWSPMIVLALFSLAKTFSSSAALTFDARGHSQYTFFPFKRLGLIVS